MQDLLHIKLQSYLAVHYPDMLLALAEEGKEEVFIREKIACISGQMEQLLDAGTPAYMVEIYCMDVLIALLPPSTYDYICDILEEEFEKQYDSFERNGILLFEVVNIIAACSLADGFNEEDKLLRYEVIGAIDSYLYHPQMAGHGV